MIEREQWQIHWVDYYKILQVDPSAEQEVIEVAFKRLVNKYHPDHNKSRSEAEEKCKLINEAYQVLRDPDKRQKYDKKWRDRVSTKEKDETDDVYLRPRPIVEPDHIFFQNVLPGETQVASFIISNRGGDYHRIRISDPNSWLRIANYSSCTPEQEDKLPLRVELQAIGEEWGKRYHESIQVELDGERTSLDVTLETRQYQHVVTRPVTKSTSNYKSVSIVAVLAILIILATLVFRGKRSSPSAPHQPKTFVSHIASTYDQTPRLYAAPSQYAGMPWNLKMSKGQVFGVLERRGEWYKIWCTIDGADSAGWISAKIDESIFQADTSKNIPLSPTSSSKVSEEVVPSSINEKNLIVNGYFESPLDSGWLEEVDWAPEHTSVSGVNWARIEDIEGSRGLHIYHSGWSRIKLWQYIPVSKTSLIFSAKFKLYAHTEWSRCWGSVSLRVVLENDFKNEFGQVVWAIGHTPAWQYYSSDSFRDTPTQRWMLWKPIDGSDGTSEWQNWIVDLEGLLEKSLTGVDRNLVKRVRLEMACWGWEPCARSEIWIDDIELVEK